MLQVERPMDMAAHVGRLIGTSDWIEIDQKMIDMFADATGDHQWIHVDVERAKRELPGGKTIAHGYLTLSLLPRMMMELYRIEKRARGLNYGSNKVRFINPVPAGARIRAAVTVKAVDPLQGGARITFESTVEIEGQSKPALVAETIAAAYD